jgi:uracil-DNA glycosylase
VRERFRPFIERLLLEIWRGDVLITLGNDAYRWFDRYCEPGVAASVWARPNRYHCDVMAVLRAGHAERTVRLCPLPHPSPANVAWAGRFPALLRDRLRSVSS